MRSVLPWLTFVHKGIDVRVLQLPYFHEKLSLFRFVPCPGTYNSTSVIQYKVLKRARWCTCSNEISSFAKTNVVFYYSGNVHLSQWVGWIDLIPLLRRSCNYYKKAWGRIFCLCPNACWEMQVEFISDLGGINESHAELSWYRFPQL